MQNTPPENPPDIDPEDRRKIMRLMRGIGRSESLRRLLNRETGDIYRSSAVVQDLIGVGRQAAEYDWKKRTLAIMALGYQPQAAEHSGLVARFLGDALLGRDTGRFDRFFTRGVFAGGRALLWVVLLVTVSILSTLLLSLLGFPEWLYGLILGLSGLCILLTPVILLGSPFYDSLRLADTQIEAANALRRLQLPESVGALAKAARGANRKEQICLQALHQLLPKLTPEHYGQLGAEAVPELGALLHYDASLSFVMSLQPGIEWQILEALEKIGDGRAVEPVQKFAERGPTLALREKATAILPILLERRDRENAHSTLLRGASAPQAAPAELLRPAAYRPAAEPELLLRPTHSSDGDANA